MGGSERTILRIRCSRELFRKFKKISVDYDSYEKALEALIEAYERYMELHPELRGRPGKYVITG